MLTALVEGAGAATGRGATALYLSPTKALAPDQLAGSQSLAVPGLRAATYDGDTPPRSGGGSATTPSSCSPTPTCVHHSLLPQHERWAPSCAALRYVVIDECHVYRGVFGSHLAALLRRLRRVAARYGAQPDLRARLRHRRATPAATPGASSGCRCARSRATARRGRR